MVNSREEDIEGVVWLWLGAFGNIHWGKKLESVKTPILEKKTWRGWFDLDNGHVGIYVLRWPTPFQAGTFKPLYNGTMFFSTWNTWNLPTLRENCENKMLQQMKTLKWYQIEWNWENTHVFMNTLSKKECENILRHLF